MVLANGGNPGKGFVKVEAAAGIPVYLPGLVFNREIEAMAGGLFWHDKTGLGEDVVRELLGKFM